MSKQTLFKENTQRQVLELNKQIMTAKTQINKAKKRSELFTTHIRKSYKAFPAHIRVVPFYSPHCHWTDEEIPF